VPGVSEAQPAVGRLDIVVLDCPDARALAAFYSALLGLAVLDEDDGWVALGTGDGTGPGTGTGSGGGAGAKLAFQQVDNYQPPKWPGRRRPQQAHLDIAVPDLAAAEERSIELGAEPLSKVRGPAAAPWRVYADPAGHPFCLVTEEFSRK
jgi:catechol 2,3-dioxygenase-like lactoylglutathione lyase family enzyme